MARRNARRSLSGVTTALIYTRVSLDEQAQEGLSLPAQLRECRRYCADKGWLIGNEYQDVLSGTRDDRAGYQALLAEARQLSGEGKPVAVVVMRLDRFGRRLVERIRSRGEFKHMGVVTHSIREGGEVSDLMANMLAVMAEEEVERLGDRVRDTRKHNVANGWHVPGRAPWGYRWRPATAEERRHGSHKAVLEIDEVTASYVREAFRMVAQDGKTPRALAAWMAGLPDVARGLIGKPGLADDGTVLVAARPRRLNPSDAQRLLRMPVYIGRFEGADEGQPAGAGNWPALIDEATWGTVQRQLQATSRGRSGPVSGEHLLTGMLVCGDCGSKMSGWTVRPGVRRYRCNGWRKGGEHTLRDCKQTAMAAPVDQDVLLQVATVLSPLANTDPALRRAIERAWERLRKPDDAAARQRRHLKLRAEKDAADARRRIGDAARLLVDGTIDRTAYAALADVEQRRLESAERALSAPEMAAPPATALPPLAVALDELDGWQTTLFMDAVPAQRRLLALLIDRVVPVRLGRGRYRADITWTPRGMALHTLANRGGAA